MRRNESQYFVFFTYFLLTKYNEINQILANNKYND